MKDIERIRELLGYLVSLAAATDQEAAKQFADELEDLIPQIPASATERRGRKPCGH